MASYAKSVSFARMADTAAYLAGDCIGSSTAAGGAVLTFTNLGTTGFQPMVVTSQSLEIDDTGIISGETSYRLYLYSQSPPSAYGDNAPWDLTAQDRPYFRGYVDLGTPVDLGSTLYVETLMYNKHVGVDDGTLYAYLVTATGYTPTSGRVYVPKLHTAGPL